MADRDVLDVIEREIADEVKTRFPGDAVQRVRLLQYGDHPMIEPGDLWVRVLLAGDPEDYERILRAFQDAHEPAIEPFLSYLRDTVWEIRIVEFMCGEDPIGREGHGPRFSRGLGERLATVTEWEHGAVTPVVAELGPPGLDTLDTLIRAGFATTRSQAIRWALDRIRARPAYQRLRDLQRDTDALKDEF
ncbi:MAG TPA: hypothetical protein VGF32_11415 [Streptosporangiaceae bacterium]